MSSIYSGNNGIRGFPGGHPVNPEDDRNQISEKNFGESSVDKTGSGQQRELASRAADLADRAIKGGSEGVAGRVVPPEAPPLPSDFGTTALDTKASIKKHVEAARQGSQKGGGGLEKRGVSKGDLLSDLKGALKAKFGYSQEPSPRLSKSTAPEETKLPDFMLTPSGDNGNIPTPPPLPTATSRTRGGGDGRHKKLQGRDSGSPTKTEKDRQAAVVDELKGVLVKRASVKRGFSEEDVRNVGKKQIDLGRKSHSDSEINVVGNIGKDALGSPLKGILKSKGDKGAKKKKGVEFSSGPVEVISSPGGSAVEKPALPPKPSNIPPGTRTPTGALKPAKPQLPPKPSNIPPGTRTSTGAPKPAKPQLPPKPTNIPTRKPPRGIK